MARKEMGLLTKQDVINYLTSSREEVLCLLREQGLDEEEIATLLKQEIAKYVKEDINAGMLKLTYAPMCRLVENFKLKDFSSREWIYNPNYLNEEDFNNLRGQEKLPLQMQEKAESSPYIFNDAGEFVDYEKVAVDPHFYVNQDQNMLFGKLIRLKHVPADARAAKLIENSKGGIAISVDDTSLFDKVMSISFCAIMEGKSKEAVVMYRYDSSRLKHNNVFIGDDFKKDVFGQEVESPHFHFQCEADSVLCLRKKPGKNRNYIYKAGRCNAIDCKHLSEYLKGLDMLSSAEIERLYYHKLHLGMPFLQMIHENKVAQCDFVKSVNKYLKSLPTQQRKQLSEVEKWIGKSYAENYDERAHEYISYDTYTIFGQVVKAIDFIDFVYTQRMQTNDITINKHLAQIELLSANEVMDCIAGVVKVKKKAKQNKTHCCDEMSRGGELMKS